MILLMYGVSLKNNVGLMYFFGLFGMVHFQMMTTRMTYRQLMECKNGLKQFRSALHFLD